jgi:hypothetical protein
MLNNHCFGLYISIVKKTPSLSKKRYNFLRSYVVIVEMLKTPILGNITSLNLLKALGYKNSIQYQSNISII